jgi:hypothetical protein
VGDLQQGRVSESLALWGCARAARIPREVHPGPAAQSAKFGANCVGTVPVKESGLIMKRRGVLQEIFPGLLARELGLDLSWPPPFFVFAFDRGWSFL